MRARPLASLILELGMATYEYTFDCYPTSPLGTFEVGAIELWHGSATVTAVRAKLSSGDGAFNFKVGGVANQNIAGDVLPTPRVWHFKADDLSPAHSDTDDVSIWYSNPYWIIDSTGSVTTGVFRQQTSAERPTYSTSYGPGSTDAVRFDVSNSESLDHYRGIKEFTGNLCMFFVVGDVDTAAPAPLVGTTDTSATDYESVYGTHERHDHNVFQSDDGNNKSVSTDKVAAGQIRYVQYDVSNGRVAEFVDGVENYGGTDTGPIQPFTFDTIGAVSYDSASEYLDAGISEIIVCEGLCDAAQRQNIEGCLAWKWGIESVLPGGHPWESGSPFTSSFTLPSDIDELDSAYSDLESCSVAITGGTPVYFYLTKAQVPGTLTVELTVT